jgi:hypothetical protein
MHRVLLGLAVGAALAAPASSKSFAAAGFSASAAFRGSAATLEAGQGGVRIHRLIGIPAGRNHRHHSGRGGLAYPYGWELYDANYDIDRSWQSDSFNDWWHDRPDRAYPRWVWHNRGCSEDRMWSSGAGWRCTP